MKNEYEALTLESLPLKLGKVSAIADQIGLETDKWKVKDSGIKN